MEENPKDESKKIWVKIIELIQHYIREGDVLIAFFYGILVIILKDNVGRVCGIGLLEVIYKLISQIINLYMMQVIKFCDKVHSFRRKRGTFTTIREIKFEMQREVYTSETLY